MRINPKFKPVTLVAALAAAALLQPLAAHRRWRGHHRLLRQRLDARRDQDPARHPAFEQPAVAVNGLSSIPTLDEVIALAQTQSAAPVFIQSFEVDNLQYMDAHTDIRLVQLVDADDLKADGYGFEDPKTEMSYYFNLGVDGVLTDFADTGVAALAAVPEPTSIALMLLGLGAVGTAARRRAR
jgi:hypothetical protein